MTQAPGNRVSALSAIMMFLVVVGLEFLVIRQFRPPAAVPASAPPTEFSSARALEHLKIIAQRPHPTGSTENAIVRGYIVRQLRTLGLNAEVQTATAAFTEPRWHGPIPAATVNNIMARLRGTSNTKAVMRTTHYDSVPSAPGASDDGSGTATLLETVRALKAGVPLKNDVIFLITDGEELGLLGAKAFVDTYADLKGIGVVLNFEARGACGPSSMFETSAHNGWLIQQFAKAAPYPVASSFAYEAYKRLPNDTDLTIFKRAGLAGLNFAYVGCWTRYHTREDSIGKLDARSLQHQGSYALALARHFGNLNLEHTTSPDAVYLSLFGVTLRYPEAWAIPLMVLALVFFAGVTVLGFKSHRLTVRGITFGFLGWLFGAILAAALCQALWAAIRGAGLASLLPYGMAYNGDLYAAAFLALTVAVLTALYVLLGRWTNVPDLTLGFLAWPVVLTGLTSLNAPGASFLFVLPLLSNLVALAYAFVSKDANARENSIWVWMLPAAAGILIFGAMPYWLILLASTTAVPVLALSTAWLLGYLAPQVQIMTARAKWLLPSLAGTTAIVFMLGARYSSGYDSGHPQADSAAYLLDADSGRAAWVSADRAPDTWTSQFLRGRMIKTSLKDLSSGAAPLPVLEAEAPAVPLAAPRVTTLDDVSFGDERTLQLLVSSARQARVVWMTIENARVLDASVNGKKIPSRGRRSNREGRPADARSWQLTYVGLPREGITLTLTVPASQTPTLRVVDQSDGLPDVPGLVVRPRPQDRMPSPRVLFDSSTLVSRTFGHFQMNHAMSH